VSAGQAGRRSHQRARHQNVVNVQPAEEEFLTQDSLGREAARLIEPTGRDIAAKNTQRQLACAPAAGLLNAGFHKPAPHPAALAGIGMDATSTLSRRHGWDIHALGPVGMKTGQ
jgi:hypothetical protein